MEMIGWLDVGSGVAGDMLLAALLDAGASIEAVRVAVDTIAPGQVRIEAREVRRGGQRATKVDVTPSVDDPHHRTWTTIRGMLHEADLHEGVRSIALECFKRLADAEGRVHGVSPEEIHFHEVGALDAIADIVGVAAAVNDLGVVEWSASSVALGAGRINAAHGSLPVPVPAVMELVTGWPVAPPPADTELATPTGMALLRTLCGRSGPLTDLTPVRTGIGAGTKEFTSHPNVVRVVIGTPNATAPAARQPSDTVCILEATVDDLPGELWPGVISAVLAAGALDAWLLPVIMKKGRPGHVLQVLSQPGDADRLSEAILAHTSTFGVRRHESLHRVVRDRTWATIQVQGQDIRVKLAHNGRLITRAAVEFEDLAAAANTLGVAEINLHAACIAEMGRQGLVAGAVVTSGQ